MKLYVFPVAPNPARVLAYVREKAIDLDIVQVDVTRGEQREAAHLARNPAGTLPVLEIGPGQHLTESLVIMEFLEECYPTPPMIGEDALSRALVRNRERRIEMTLLLPIIYWVHATNSPLGLPANPEFARRQEARLPDALAEMDALLAEQTFAAGDHVSIADCTLLAAMRFGRFGSYPMPADLPHLARWCDMFEARHA